jgi:2-dehydro-3-deoxyphosphogluconate aldolase/(4S)-4-hydroxy-2-oxoglutarate aldolase
VTPSAQVIEAINAQRALAIVRLESTGDAVTACRLLGEAGMRAVEISLAQPNATAAIAEAADELSGITFLGAGTVRTVADAAAAVDAGAEFLVSPGLDLAVAAWAQERDVLYLPGALTPTEVETAARWSPLVKLFPAGTLGPRYVRDLRAPFPDVALVPTGGVDLENARAYLEAGAAAVAIGSALVNQHSLAAPGELTQAARRLLQLVAPAASTTRRH